MRQSHGFASSALLARLLVHLALPLASVSSGCFAAETSPDAPRELGSPAGDETPAPDEDDPHKPAPCGTDSRPTKGAGIEVIYSFLDRGCMSVADGILRGMWDLGPRYTPTPIPVVTWNEDPFDKYWRFLFYGLRPATNLMWAYYETGNAQYRDQYLTLLDSFADAYTQRPLTECNPTCVPLYDRHRFDDAHTTAFMAMIVVNSYVKLDRSGDLSPTLRGKLEAVLERAGTSLVDEKNYERTNNHGLNEAAALALIAAAFPNMPRAPAWLDLASKRLETLMVTIIDDDGVLVENSPFYHYYVLTLASQLVRWAKTYNVPLSHEFVDRTESMVPYATQITMPNGLVPLLGASVTTQVHNLDSNVYGPIAASSPEFAWVYSAGAMGTPSQERAVIFPVSGAAVLRSTFGTGPADLKSATHITFNVGPWRGRHSHLDVLGINLYASGINFLPDSGLYTYVRDEEFAYFSGTRGHNTVVVDGLDQAPGIDFYSTFSSRNPVPEIARDVHAGLTAADSVYAYQSGLHRTYPGVTHRRAVLIAEKDMVVVVDDLASDEVHDYAQLWHLSPETESTASGLEVNGTTDGRLTLALRQAEGSTATLAHAHGQTAPMQGFFSRVYGKKVASDAYEYRVHGRNAQFATLITTASLARLDRLVKASFAEGAVHVTACAGSVRKDVTIHAMAEGREGGESIEVGEATAASCLARNACTLAPPTMVATARNKVQIRAVGSCPDLTRELRYWVALRGQAPTLVRDWSSNDSADWLTDGLPAGQYTVTVDVRPKGGVESNASASVTYVLAATP